MENPILYLNEGYCMSFDELKSVIVANAADKAFRKELLAAYSDCVLSEWVKNVCHQSLKSSPKDGILDDQFFSQLYLELIGEKCAINFDSSFAELGKLKYILLDGKRFDFIGKAIEGNLQAEKSSYNLSFVFESKQASNSTIVFKVKTCSNSVLLESKVLWKNKTKGSEVSFQAVLTKSLLLKPFYLVEGVNNKLCSFSFTKIENPQKKVPSSKGVPSQTKSPSNMTQAEKEVALRKQIDKWVVQSVRECSPRTTISMNYSIDQNFSVFKVSEERLKDCLLRKIRSANILINNLELKGCKTGKDASVRIYDRIIKSNLQDAQKILLWSTINKLI